MINSDIINSKDMSEYIRFTFVNKDDLTQLLTVFNNKSQLDFQKIIYLIYNEYFNYNNIILEEDWHFDDPTKTYYTYFLNPYKYQRVHFIRDYIVTLSLEDYQNKENIVDQIKIIYETLSQEEKDLIEKIYLLGNTEIIETKYEHLMEFIRIKENPDLTIHAPIEKYINRVNNTNFMTNENIFILNSILKKISLGTIH